MHAVFLDVLPFQCQSLRLSHPGEQEEFIEDCVNGIEQRASRGSKQRETILAPAGVAAIDRCLSTTMAFVISYRGSRSQFFKCRSNCCRTLLLCVSDRSCGRTRQALVATVRVGALIWILLPAPRPHSRAKPSAVWRAASAEITGNRPINTRFV